MLVKKRKWQKRNGHPKVGKRGRWNGKNRIPRTLLRFLAQEKRVMSNRPRKRGKETLIVLNKRDLRMKGPSKEGGDYITSSPEREW